MYVIIRCYEMLSVEYPFIKLKYKNEGKRERENEGRVNINHKINTRIKTSKC